MTNKEKFKEVFGFDLHQDICVAPDHEYCEKSITCYGCPWEHWLDQKYEVPKNDGNNS